MVGAGCTGAGTLSKAEINPLKCSARVALYSERSLCTFTSHYLASQHLYGLELTDMYAALLNATYYYQGLSETLGNLTTTALGYLHC